jgi:hypothetical protein
VSIHPKDAKNLQLKTGLALKNETSASKKQQFLNVQHQMHQNDRANGWDLNYMNST